MYIHTYKHIFRFLKNKFIYLLLLFFYFWLCWVFVTARRLSSVVVAHGLSSCGLWALEHRLSSCGTRASLLRGMWDLPRPGLEPVSPALAGRFSTTAPPRKPQTLPFDGNCRVFREWCGFREGWRTVAIFAICCIGQALYRT